MRKALLGSAAMLGVGVASTSAFAADGIKLSLGGFFNSAIEGNAAEWGHGSLDQGHYDDGVYSDTEIYFVGKTTLDNGLTVGTRVELEGEQKSDQIDAAYVYFQGGFGELRVGSQNGALMAMCITPVGGTTNFGALSQYQVISNAFSGYSNGVCNDVDGFGLGIPADATRSQKIVYITPNFGGFQLGLSWAPNGGHEFTGVSDFHSGQPTVEDGEQRNILDAYATFNHDFSSWSIQAGGGGSWTTETGGSGSGVEKNAYYQGGLNLTFGSFSVGAAGEYYDNYAHFDDGSTGDAWAVGGGAAYNINAFTVGFQYSYGDYEFTDKNVDRRTNAVALTANYAVGPGIALNGAIEYTWANGDSGDDAHGGYHALSLGLGSSLTF